MNKQDTLNGVQSQIGAFDNKASVLLSIVGIIFAFSLSFLDVFNEDYFACKTKCYKTTFSVLFILFVITTIASILCFIMVIIPRKHKGDKLYPNYYRDIVKMNLDELDAKIKSTEKEDEENFILEQISINSKICMTKHIWLIIGIIFMLSFLAFITALTILNVLG